VLVVAVALASSVSCCLLISGVRLILVRDRSFHLDELCLGKSCVERVLSV